MAEPVPGSDGWYLKVLAHRMHDRRVGKGWSWEHRSLDNDVRPGLDHLWSWKVGNPPLPECAAAWNKAMRPIIRMCTVNIAPRICASITDRLAIAGWNTALDRDEDADQTAALVAAGNDFGVNMARLWDYVVPLGAGYTVVGPPRDASTKIPVVSIEDPRYAITSEDPRTGVTRAGLKLSRDEWDAGDVAVLFLPGKVRVYRRPGMASALGRASLRMNLDEWTEDTGKGGSGTNPGNLTGVAMTPVTTPDGRGEYEPHLGLLRRINDQVLNALSIAKFQAFKQRAVKNLPDKDDKGNEIDYSEAFIADPGSMWRLPEGVEVWESTPVEMSGIRGLLQDSYKEVAIVTGMPLHYITPDAAQGSAEGASTMKEANSFRTERMQRSAESGINATMSKALAAMGETGRADVSQIKTLWQAADRPSMTERTNAFSQARTNGIPTEIAAREFLGFGPQDLERMRNARASDLFYETDAKPA